MCKLSPSDKPPLSGAALAESSRSMSLLPPSAPSASPASVRDDDDDDGASVVSFDELFATSPGSSSSSPSQASGPASATPTTDPYVRCAKRLLQPETAECRRKAFTEKARSCEAAARDIRCALLLFLMNLGAPHPNHPWRWGTLKIGSASGRTSRERDAGAPSSWHLGVYVMAKDKVKIPVSMPVWYSFTCHICKSTGTGVKFHGFVDIEFHNLYLQEPALLEAVAMETRVLNHHTCMTGAVWWPRQHSMIQQAWVRDLGRYLLDVCLWPDYPYWLTAFPQLVINMQGETADNPLEPFSILIALARPD
ncbi:hypothetical protein BDW71DRAFT_211948 [Aspergillus fruticulosus]